MYTKQLIQFTEVKKDPILTWKCVFCTHTCLYRELKIECFQTHLNYTADNKMSYLHYLGIILLILHGVGLLPEQQISWKRQFKNTKGRKEAKLYQSPITDDLCFCYKFSGRNLCGVFSDVDAHSSIPLKSRIFIVV